MADSVAKQHGLGRGLSALLGEESEPALPAPAAARGGPREVPIAWLKANPNQPRHSFKEEDLEDLTASIREKGVIQPILVRKIQGETDRYEIVAGERRWRAAQRAQLHDVPVIIKDLTDAEALELGLIENVQRADLNAVEEALGYRTLIDQFRYTQEQLAEVMGKSRSHVANTLRLLTLPDPVRAMIVDGALSAGHARTLIGRSDAEAMARTIVTRGLNVRAAERARAGDGKHKPKGKRPKEAAPKDADTRALEAQLSNALGLEVDVMFDEAAGGHVLIRYKTLDQLDEICRRLTAAGGGRL